MPCGDAVPENAHAHWIEPRQPRSYWEMPDKTGDLKVDDPYAYLDEDDAIVWMANGECHYMNVLGEVGVVPVSAKIRRRLGYFRGIAIEPTAFKGFGGAGESL